MTRYINYAPSKAAIYIPNWLSQTKRVSMGAKMIYGRLMAWVNKDGDCFRSASDLSLECGMSMRSVQGAVQELREFGLLETFQKTKGGTNWYRFPEHPIMKEPVIDQLLTKEEKNEQNTQGQNDPTLRKSCAPLRKSCAPPYANPAQHKNKKEITNNKKTIGHSENGLDRFDEFWNSYPRKEKKKTARRIWQKQKLDTKADEIISDVTRRKATEWREKAREYIPHPSTYLNQERWTDEGYGAFGDISDGCLNANSNYGWDDECNSHNKGKF